MFWPVSRLILFTACIARGSLRLSSRFDRHQDLGAPFPPRIELVGGVTSLPRLERLVALAIEPIGAPKLVIRLDQVRAQRNGLLEERLRVLEHVPLEIHQSEIEVRVQRRLSIVVEAD